MGVNAQNVQSPFGTHMGIYYEIRATGVSF